MKKMFALLLAATFALSLTACDKDSATQKQSDNPPAISSPADAVTPPANENITNERAKELALTHAGVAVQDVERFEIELDVNDKGVALYEIEFFADGYEYDVDAVSGEILKSEKGIDD